MTIYWEDEGNDTFDFSVEEQLQKLTSFVVDYVNCPYEVEVSVTLVDKDEIHRLNKEFRNVDKPTDVLSFPMMEYEKTAEFESDIFEQSIVISPETEELMLGDIVICSQVVDEQAKQYGHSKIREFSFLVVHSLLHLFGYDHIEENERIQMEQVQKDIMEKLQINR